MPGMGWFGKPPPQEEVDPTLPKATVRENVGGGMWTSYTWTERGPDHRETLGWAFNKLDLIELGTRVSHQIHHENVEGCLTFHWMRCIPIR